MNKEDPSEFVRVGDVMKVDITEVCEYLYDPSTEKGLVRVTAIVVDKSDGTKTMYLGKVVKDAA